MEYLLTSLELEKLENQIKELENEELEVSARMKQIAKEDNYYLENSMYKKLRQRLNYDIPLKKEHIRKKISKARIVEEDLNRFDGETVAIGTKVVLDYDGVKEEFKIMPVSESNLEQGILACDAPIVACILGKKKEDTIKFNGFNVTIVDVKKV